MFAFAQLFRFDSLTNHFHAHQFGLFCEFFAFSLRKRLETSRMGYFHFISSFKFDCAIKLVRFFWKMLHETFGWISLKPPLLEKGVRVNFVVLCFDFFLCCEIRSVFCVFMLFVDVVLVRVFMWIFVERNNSLHKRISANSLSVAIHASHVQAYRTQLWRISFSFIFLFFSQCWCTNCRLIMRVVYVSAISAIICVLCIVFPLCSFCNKNRKNVADEPKREWTKKKRQWKNYVKLKTHTKKGSHMPNENLIGKTDRSNSTHIPYSKSTWIYFAKGIKHETVRFIFFLVLLLGGGFFFLFQRCEDLRCGVWSARWLSPLQPGHKYDEEEKKIARTHTLAGKIVQNRDSRIDLFSLCLCMLCLH